MIAFIYIYLLFIVGGDMKIECFKIIPFLRPCFVLFKRVLICPVVVNYYLLICSPTLLLILCYVTSPRDPQSVLTERTLRDFHHIPLADMNVYPVSFTPKEWVVESVVAPVCKVPCSEPLVLSRCSDPMFFKKTGSKSRG